MIPPWLVLLYIAQQTATKHKSQIPLCQHTFNPYSHNSECSSALLHFLADNAKLQTLGWFFARFALLLLLLLQAPSSLLYYFKISAHTYYWTLKPKSGWLHVYPHVYCWWMRSLKFASDISFEKSHKNRCRTSRKSMREWSTNIVSEFRLWC